MPDWLVQFLEDPPPCLTLEGEELVEKNPGKILKVRVAVTFVYLPRDESFGHLKSSDFLVYILKSASQNVIPQLQSALSLQFNQPEFNSFYDVRGLDDGGIKLPTNTLSQLSPIPLFKELFRTDGEQALKFPTPKVIQVEQSAWMTDEEFAREMTAVDNLASLQIKFIAGVPTKEQAR
ncbi:hypothetical protein GLYMA_07G007102v4 [Glycine max]|nr:hypothetical protein GLYMA_07G007102v4 [Glycine max]KAH1084711.1 hypothetical protein GYH30_017002 [Glycine max]